MKLTTTLFSALTLVAAGSAQAAFVATMTQVGNDVVLTGSGTLNVNGLDHFQSSATDSMLISGWALFLSGPGGTDDYTGYNSVDMTGPANLGSTSEAIHGSVGTGSYFGAQGGEIGFMIFAPLDYVSGSFFSGSTVFTDVTLEDLGVAMGSYVWSWGTGEDADTLTLNVAVPEPAHYAIGAGVAALALVALRRRVK